VSANRPHHDKPIPFEEPLPMNLRTKYTILVVWGVLVFVSSASTFAADTVKLVRSDNTVAVAINGEDFATYQFAKSLPKPFFSPVKLAGTQISRPIVGEDYKGDHPHHKGIWVSVDEVNEIKFWAEKGKIENRSLELLAAEGNPAKLKTVNHWIGPDGQDVLIETTTIGIHANRLLTYDIRFKMASSDVHFRDTKEGLLGFRIAESMREDKGSGVITNADGKNGSKECWGQRSAWVDYVGPVEGKSFGVTIFDHPKNFRPSRYHVRNYGLFSVSPFGEAAYTNNQEKPVDDVFPKGSELRIRYGIFFHTGDAASAKLPDVNAQFLKASE
jgi:hypothetical protein